MFGIPILTLLKFAAIAILALIVAGMLYAAYQHVVDKGRAEVREQYAPLIGKCGKRAPAECASEWTTAIAANESLQADVAKIDDERKACSASIKGWRDLADRAATVAQQNAKAAEGAIAQLRGSRDSSLAKSRRPSASESCEQILDELDKDSLDLAQKRAILFPSEKTPAPPADKVRIGK